VGKGLHERELMLEEGQEGMQCTVVELSGTTNSRTTYSGISARTKEPLGILGP
jgi:hypothetical protein